MNNQAIMNDYGTLIEPATLQITRLLPGPIERCWSYLTQSDLRRQWLAAGEMKMELGATFEWVWRNDEVSDEPSERPADFPEEHRMQAQITELHPPHKLSITWGSTGGVSFELTSRGDKVLLTVTHHRVMDQSVLLNVSAGWHAHLDILVARLKGERAGAFWPRWGQLKNEYKHRHAA